MSPLALGIDIGGTKISAGVVDEAGALYGRPLTVDTEARAGADALLDQCFVLLDKARAMYPEIAAIGIGSAGVFDDDGVVVSATDILPGWTGTDLSGAVREHVRLPVVSLNDVHAAAVGEHAVGAAAGRESALIVAVGTGIGGAVIIEGRIVRGRTGAAGSVGHMTVITDGVRQCSCGLFDHVEPYGSGPGLEKTYADSTGSWLPLRTIASQARSGDPQSIAAIHDGALMLSRAVANSINLIDPELVVIGGGVAQIGDIYLEALTRGVQESCLGAAADVPLVAAQLGNRSAIVGAALVAHRLLVQRGGHAG